MKRIAITNKLDERHEGAKKYLPSRFPTKSEINSLYLMDKPGTLLFLTWLLEYNDDMRVTAENKEAILYAQEILDRELV